MKKVLALLCAASLFFFCCTGVFAAEGKGSITDPGRLSVSDPGKGSILDPGKGSVLDPGRLSVSDPGKGSILDPGKGSITDPNKPGSDVPVDDSSVSKAEETITEVAGDTYAPATTEGGDKVEALPLISGTLAEKLAVAEVLENQDVVSTILEQSFTVPDTVSFEYLTGGIYTIVKADGSAAEGPATLVIDLSDADVATGDSIYALHFDGDAWECRSAVVGSDKKVTLQFSSLSPVLIYKAVEDGKTVALAPIEEEEAPGKPAEEAKPVKPQISVPEKDKVSPYTGA